MLAALAMTVSLSLLTAAALALLVLLLSFETGRARLDGCPKAIVFWGKRLGRLPIWLNCFFFEALFNR